MIRSMGLMCAGVSSAFVFFDGDEVIGLQLKARGKVGARRGVRRTRTDESLLDVTGVNQKVGDVVNAVRESFGNVGKAHLMPIVPMLSLSLENRNYPGSSTASDPSSGDSRDDAAAIEAHEDAAAKWRATAEQADADAAKLYDIRSSLTDHARREQEAYVAQQAEKLRSLVDAAKAGAAEDAEIQDLKKMFFEPGNTGRPILHGQDHVLDKRFDIRVRQGRK